MNPSPDPTSPESLYQEVILDHSRHPRNQSENPQAQIRIEAENPLCGDELVLFLQSADGQILRTTFTSQACAICTASASLLTTKIRQISPEQARQLSAEFQNLLQQPPESPIPPELKLGDLRALEGVRKFPMRVKCATLAWHALDQALDELSAPAK
jgi:nitrogen fixation NifU-like protein